MKTLLLSCLIAFTLVSIVGCCDDDHHTAATTTYDSSVTDSKNMQHR